MTILPNKSYLAQQVTMQNFVPQLSALLEVSNEGASGVASVTFQPLTSVGRSTFKITNTGEKTAYIGWGTGSATATISGAFPAPYCDAIAPGAIFTQDFINESTGTTVDTIAAICANTDTTTLEITYGSGQ
jgi:hypothetical protein